MNVAGAGQGDLGRAPGERFQEPEVLGVLRPFPFDAADHRRNAPRHAMAMALRPGPALVLRTFDLHAGDAGAGEAVGIGAAPELAVGDDIEARSEEHTSELQSL